MKMNPRSREIRPDMGSCAASDFRPTLPISVPAARSPLADLAGLEAGALANLWLRRGASHLVEDVTAYFHMPHVHEVGVERDEFELACARLQDAGYRLRDGDGAWEAFSALRANYAGDLNSMARYWAVPPAQWIGDRSAVPHAPA